MGVVVEGSELVDVIFEGGDDTGRSIFEKELYHAECFEYFSPAF